MELTSVYHKSAHYFKRFNDSNYRTAKILEAYRVVSSPARLLPNFLIIGTQKGGTTSLYRYLEQHPCVASAFTKEVHFFDNHTRDFKYGKGISWYRSHFRYSVSKLFCNYVYGQPLITGEASPDYISDLHAPRRIAQDLPDVKLIVMLRNPVDRAYSHYLHNRRASWDPGREPLSFDAAIAQEEERTQDEKLKLLNDERYFSYNYMHYTYLNRGHYAEQLDRWFKLFPRKQIFIIKSENFFANPKDVYAQVLDFLKLPAWELPEFKSFNARNEKEGEMTNLVRERLLDYFSVHNQKLYQLLNIDFGWD